MASEEELRPIINALLAYNEDQQTLQFVTEAAQQVFGDEWISLLPDAFDQFQGVDVSLQNTLKEKANHAVHYYGALAAWEEAHQYLNASEPVEAELLSDRIPTLEYWLALFGQDGKNVVARLKQLLSNVSSPVAAETPTVQETSPLAQETVEDISLADVEQPVETDVPAQEPAVSDTAAFEEIETQIEEGAVLPTEAILAAEEQPVEQPAVLETVTEAPVYPEVVSQDTVFSEEDLLETTPPEPVQEEVVIEEITPDEAPVNELEASFNEEASYMENPETEMPQVIDEIVQEETVGMPVIDKKLPPKNWELATFLKEKNLYEQVVAWVTAKCIHDGNIELRQYKHYGFIVEMMRALSNDAQNLLDNRLLDEVIEQQLEGGRETIERFKIAIDAELSNLPEDEAKPAENIIDVKDARAIFGQLDSSNTKEYLGPAPDGFELMEDPYSESKEDILKAYERTEANMDETVTRLDVLQEGQKSTPDEDPEKTKE